MRTDSPRLADEGVTAAAAGFISRPLRRGILSGKPRVFKTKGNAQDAHESHPSVQRPKLLPEEIRKSGLTPDQFKLYRLIWSRF